MKNGLADISDMLIAQIEKLSDDNITNLDEELFDREMKKNDAICKVTASIVDVGRLQFDAMKYYEEMGIPKAEKLDLFKTSSERKAIAASSTTAKAKK